MLNHHLLHYFPNRDMDALFFSVFFKTITSSMIGLFLPVLLWEQSLQLGMIALFYLILYSVNMIFFPIALQWCTRIGCRRMIMMGIVCELLFFMVSRIHISLLNAMLLGLSWAFYYSGFHLMFTNDSNARYEGREVSMLSVISIIAGILGPVLGGFALALGGRIFFFSIALASSLVSIVILMLCSDVIPNPTQHISWRDISHDKMAFFTVNGLLNALQAVWWPLFIYQAIISFRMLGTIVGITAVIMVFVNLLLGMLSDVDTKGLLRFSTFLYAPLWIIRIFVQAAISLFAVHTLATIFQSALNIGVSKLFYSQTKKMMNNQPFIIMTEVSLYIGRLLLLSMVLLFNSLPLVFAAGFFIITGYGIYLEQYAKKI